MLGCLFQTLLVLLVVCLTVLYFYLRHTYGYWKSRGVPYEEPTMFIGNLGTAMRTSMWDLMYVLMKKHKTDYFGIYLGWKPALVVNSRDLAKNIIVRDFDFFQNRYVSPGHQDPEGAFNLLTAKNPMWSTLKHEMSPIFTSLRLKVLTELMNVNAAELVKRIRTDYIENELPVDLKELFAMYTSDTAAYTVFGLKVSVLRDHLSPLWPKVRQMVNWSFWRGLEFILIFFTPALAQILRLKLFSASATAYTKQLFWEVVNNRQDAEKTCDKDLVNHLMKLNENSKLPDGGNSQMADDIMVAQSVMIIFGAIQASSTTLSYLLHELAYHPDKQEKLYNEISEALRTKGTDNLQFNDLTELNYLTACVKETLRKYPPFAFLDRVCTIKYQLNDKVMIEEGTPVYVNVNAIHYNEEFYPDPEEWNPERFGESSDNNNHDFTFIPFGDGPRFCIGKRYAFAQIRTAIIHMVKNFKFEPAEPYIIEKDPYSLILVPKGGGKVRFIPRKEN